MFVTDDMINEMVSRYGTPSHASFRIETPVKEFDFIRSTQKNGRDHDVTIYAIKDGKVAVIAKHFYPPGLYRAPSGGLNPGESFSDGARREMAEEIGCEIELEKFVLQTSVEFIREGTDGTPDDNVIPWRSFVFLAKYVCGDFKFTDTREIREVKLADWSEFDGFMNTMRESTIGGFHYRAALHEKVASLLK